MTKIFNISSDATETDKIKEAAGIILKNGTVAFPTETVYGLGANGLNEEAVKKVFTAKGRPSDNPLILHIADRQMLNDLVKEIPVNAILLIDKYWPGPLTLVFKKSKLIPDIITAGLDTVAIRMPSNNVALRLIQESKVPIAAPSANISGRPSTTKAQHVIDDLNGKVDGIIVSDDSTIGVESTVLDVSESIPILLRPGGITIEQLESVIGQVLVDKGIMHETEIVQAKSPGMKYKHYAPKAPLKIIKGDTPLVIKKINEISKEYQSQGKKVGVLATEDTKQSYYKDNIVISMGERSRPETVMLRLFDCLREFDKYNVDIILAEGFSEKGLELTISNRLNKAAGFDITEIE
ncbi:threonylcarbamoyl-AMP synthase [Alkalibaculum sp. M08DMB]|uniref:Threonylcarbamoyl-AMP synthase n=1 Tax=Alkalibaculum sporogenes TaxID=2655001 RepID=A0A6A7KCE2_9FIRM|nr:L-threonylcarbamoyladenylate synthase [Alkalibaculum sporogenes]MPW27015.1 threonylcarbamoyl-AMP synthase [Alkalibaculum sporogenes]